MEHRIETRQALFERELFPFQRRDHYAAIFHRDADALISVEMRFTGNADRQANTVVGSTTLNLNEGVCWGKRPPHS